MDKFSKANHYTMPALEDYLGARCLLLNNIFVGLTVGHEAIEKLLKGLLILEELEFPRRCHKLVELSGLLVKKDLKKFIFLNDVIDFVKRLDKHYGWRYYDGEYGNRSKDRSIREVHDIDSLWIYLYECYMDFFPDNSKYRTYLISYLFMPDIQHFGWSQWLLTDNEAIQDKIVNWKKEFDKWYGN